MNEACGCCEGLEPLTPLSTANRPGLEALMYRVGTHATFLETMKARLSSSEFPSLANLRVRDAEDPAIALLDAWAMIADVLTFYQERIVNEGYLRTATERRSVLELARLVGYTLRPGVSATVFPAFMMEIGYNKKDSEIPQGTKIQSLPGPGEMPQFFETAEKIAARTDWNEIKPRLSRPLAINRENAGLVETVYLKGIATNLRAGDPLLLTFRFETTDINPDYPEPTPVLRKVATVEPQPVENLTKVTFQPEPLDDEKFLKAFGKTVEKYRKVTDFGIDDESQVVTPILQVLNELIEQPFSQDAALDLLTTVIQYTTDLDSSNGDPLNNKDKRQSLFLAVFNLKKYSIESIWLNRLISELEKLVRGWYLSLKDDPRTINNKSLKNEILSWANWLKKLNESSPQQILDWYKAWLFAQYQPEESSSNILEIPELIPSFDSLSEVVAPLSQSPSLPPANRFRLIRNISDTFNAHSDLRPRLIETLSPILEPTLNQALVSNDRLPALPLKIPEAMRVKAAPFGHNAPLRPEYDSNGAIEGYTEWPIATTSIRIRISPPTTGRPLDDILELPVSLSLQSNAQIQNMEVKLRAMSSPDPVTVNGIRVEISEIGERFFPLTFTFRFPGQSREFTFGDSEDFLVKIDEDTWRVSPGETLRDKFNGRQVVISASGGTREEGAFISVLDESPAQISDQNKKIVALDAQYDQIQAGNWISIVTSKQTAFYQVIDTQTVSKTDYGISSRVTQLTLDNPWLDEEQLLSKLREVTIYAQGEPLALSEEPLTSEPICGKTIELGTIYEGLKAGRWLIVSGERVDVPNTKVSELVMLSGVQNPEPDPLGAKPYSTLTLSTKLAYVYKRDTVTIYGNVVKATHGETRTEVLGSGDGSKAFQQFPLRQPPLTYLAAPTPSGAASTLQLRVNDILWRETDSLAGLKPTDRLYLTKTDDNGMTTVLFGNGESGARLPTGIENVRAAYRNGIGKAGNVKAEQISQLATRPLGLKGVINPLPATGGADRENRDQARNNAPLAVMSLDRLVSVQDYADFARTFAGIGKASAVRLSDGNRQVIHVTIAGSKDIPIDEKSDLYRNLLQALHDFGDPYQPIQLAVRKLILLIIAAKVRVLPDYQWESVEPQIRAALLDAFGFERQELGQSVWLSKAVTIIQQVQGVAYVDVDLFNNVSEEAIRTTSSTKEKRKLLIDGAEIETEFNQDKNNLAIKLDQLPTEPPLSSVNARLAKIDPKNRVIIPAQLAIFSPNVADTLILTELKP